MMRNIRAAIHYRLHNLKSAIKFNSLTISILLGCVLPSALPADERIAIKLFGAPDGFSEQIRSFDESETYLTDSNVWVSTQDSGLLVIFTDNANDSDFVPAALQNLYRFLTIAVKSHIYTIPRATLAENLDADVLFILRDNLDAHFAEFNVEAPMEVEAEHAFMDCYSAGLVFRHLAKDDREVATEEIVEHCSP